MDRLEFKTTSLAIDLNGAISGLAWPFSTPDRTGDVILPGAFQGVELPLPLLWQHDPADPLGVWESATETPEGLEVRGRLLIDDVPKAREARALCKAGAVTGLSIGFRTIEAKPRKGGGRTISKLELVEISLVTVPAHPLARVAATKTASNAIALAEAINRAAMAFQTRK